MKFTLPFAAPRSSDTAAAAGPLSPAELAEEFRIRHADVVAAVNSVIRHPRSLSRPTASWRPPVIKLPRTDNGPQLSVAVTRRRVGPRAKARIRGFGQEQVPAYLVELRISDTTGFPVDRLLTEAWVRSFIPEDVAHTVHELPSTRAANYVWLVDGTFAPIESPSSLFEGLAAA